MRKILLGRKKLKHTYGIYFVTLEKSNSVAETCSINQVDASDPRNNGVLSDHLVGTADGVTLRRIVYITPQDDAIYTYLTNDFTLPAYQIVLLYKHRWDIEKIFHQFKSKMGERKSWASSLEAKQSHAIFECLAHNLLLLFEQYLGHSEGLRDELGEKKNKAGPDRPRSHHWPPASSGRPEISSTQRSTEPPSAPSASSAGCVSGSTSRLPGEIPSPASEKYGPQLQDSFPPRSEMVLTARLL